MSVLLFPDPTTANEHFAVHPPQPQGSKAGRCFEENLWSSQNHVVRSIFEQTDSKGEVGDVVGDQHRSECALAFSRRHR